jgi:large conductance mechanosensitive channel
MSVLKEFKDFTMRGNVVDMAVGIVIGSAFGKIVSSLVNDIIMPPIGLLLGGLDFNSFMITIKAATGESPAVAIRWGTFVNIIVDFVIVAFVLFMVIKLMNSMKKKKAAEPAAPPKPSAEETLLAEIRDLLKQGR